MKAIDALATADPPLALADALNATKPTCADAFAAAAPPKAAVDAKAPTTKETTKSKPTHSNIIPLGI